MQGIAASMQSTWKPGVGVSRLVKLVIQLSRAVVAMVLLEQLLSLPLPATPAYAYAVGAFKWAAAPVVVCAVV
jgi:hypothetical protein